LILPSAVGGGESFNGDGPNCPFQVASEFVLGQGDVSRVFFHLNEEKKFL
jgi:hypothetical protein